MFQLGRVPEFQWLLAARRDLALEKELHRPDAFDVLILDDIGYIQ
jgi:DNA replication protein DnaC